MQIVLGVMLIIWGVMLIAFTLWYLRIIYILRTTKQTFHHMEMLLECIREQICILIKSLWDGRFDAFSQIYHFCYKLAPLLLLIIFGICRYLFMITVLSNRHTIQSLWWSRIYCHSPPLFQTQAYMWFKKLVNQHVFSRQSAHCEWWSWPCVTLSYLR